MGKTIKEWRTYIKGLTNKHLEELIGAINTLMDFDEICKEYTWTGIDVIRGIAKQELQERSIRRKRK